MYVYLIRAPFLYHILEVALANIKDAAQPLTENVAIDNIGENNSNVPAIDNQGFQDNHFHQRVCNVIVIIFYVFYQCLLYFLCLNFNQNSSVNDYILKNHLIYRLRTNTRRNLFSGQAHSCRTRACGKQY